MASPGSLPPTAPKGTVDFSVIGEGFDIYGKNWLAFSVFTIVIFVAAYAVSIILTLPATMASMSAPVTTDTSQLFARMIAQQLNPFAIIASLVAGAIIGIGQGGITIMAFKALQGQRVDIADGFSAFSNIVPYGVAGIGIAILTRIGMYMCCIPGLILAGLFICIYPVITKEKLGVIDAFKRSMQIGSPHILMITLFAFVQSLLAGIGIIGCCIGVLATFPAAYICSTLIYRDLVGFADPQAATVYPRDGGGSMPGYQAPPDDPTPPPGDGPPTPPQG